MKKVIIEVPEGWKPGECKACSSYSICGLKEMDEECPLANAKEAVGPLSGKQIHPDAMEYHTGINCKVYAVEDK